ncbi:hypothetical protein PC9H_011587 [Pleurotus ostreatus]|uniref:Velvet domain-containing protein n=2 Tax=Pleurotus ostreatus TaxID=5322 RepID=A0A067N752_PLEO1|nr:uncharacterized protein PC9H_011587 [Pleurotus ostreatus]KAF7421067.1 hypothetical protein PC9H_011587 [Pleurotus ostreatus]KDQ23818.1 hypothetical protein PLEOSDRAFT_162177 [Pleurotus ostreatus PC15]
MSLTLGLPLTYPMPLPPPYNAAADTDHPPPYTTFFPPTQPQQPMTYHNYPSHPHSTYNSHSSYYGNTHALDRDALPHPNREYELTVRQEPKQARMCGIGGKADRRPIDPPPIVQLRVIDPSHRRRNLQAPPPPHGLHSYSSQSSQSTQLQQHSSPPAQNSNIPPHQRRKAIHIASPSHATTSSAAYGAGGRGGLRSDDERDDEGDEDDEGNEGDDRADARRSTSRRGGRRNSRGRGAEGGMLDDDHDMSGR